MPDLQADICTICGTPYYALNPEPVYQDERWIAHGMMNIPGWVTVSTRRHAEGLFGLSDEEASSMGRVANLIAQAQQEICSAERVYVIGHGEAPGALHWHFVLIPRSPEIPPAARAVAIMANIHYLQNPEEADRVAAAIRERVTAQAPV